MWLVFTVMRNDRRASAQRRFLRLPPYAVFAPEVIDAGLIGFHTPVALVDELAQ
jgi:hypothetical protein